MLYESIGENPATVLWNFSCFASIQSRMQRLEGGVKNKIAASNFFTILRWHHKSGEEIKFINPGGDKMTSKKYDVIITSSKWRHKNMTSS
jgi:hypothetical protein